MRWLISIVGILLVVGALAAIKGAQIGRLVGFGKQAQKDGPPPEAISTSVATETAWEGTIAAVGSVASAKGVTIAADAAGIVTRIAFESGATVKKGDILLQQDARVEQAQLASAIARRDLAKTTTERSRSLGAKGAISRAEVDADESAGRTAGTDAESVQAQIAKKTVRAPFGGKLGIRTVNLGQYLQPGTPIVVLETPDAVHVDFSLPQQRLAEIAVGQPVRVTVDGSVTNDADGGAGLAPIGGKIAAVDPTVDPVTRTIRVRADLDASDGLRPGMFVQVAVILPEQKKVVTVPQTAIVHAPYGDSVFIVEDKPEGTPGPAKSATGQPVRIARQHFVRVGSARGDFVSIVDGVKTGQEIVTSGAFKLRNNAAVYVDNTKQPTPMIAPRPENR